MATYTGALDSPKPLARAATGRCGTGCDAAFPSSSWDVRINRAGRNDQAEYVAIFTRVSTKPGVAGSSPAGRANLARFCESADSHLGIRRHSARSPRPVGTYQLKYFSQFPAHLRASANGEFSSPSLRFQPVADRWHRPERWQNQARTLATMLVYRDEHDRAITQRTLADVVAATLAS